MIRIISGHPTAHHQDGPAPASALRWVAALLVALVASSAAEAQPSGVLERQRIQEEQQRQELSATEYLKPPKRDYTAFDWGGWSSTSVYAFKDDDNSRSTFDLFHNLLITDFRVWTKVVTKGGLGVYVRAKKLHHTFDLGMLGVAPDEQNVDAFDLDVAFADFPVGDFRFRLGRQLTIVGRGLALLDNLDSLSIRWAKGAWALNSFYGRTPPLEDNLDTSVGPPGSGDAERRFGGLQVSRTDMHGRHAYAYALLETDRTDIKSGVATPGSPHSYDAQYYGLGIDGPIRHKWIGYVEGIAERGRTFSQNVLLDATTSMEDIDARALIAAAQYLFGDRRTSVGSLEYAFGSGDSDRGSVLNVLGAGNRPHTDDTGFNYFGYYDLGLALTPRLSNLEVWRLGYSIKPFLDRKGRPKDFQIGAKGTLYHKDTAQGAVSSTTATQANLGFADVGSAVDVFSAWKILSDASLTIQWGRFWPGSAYSVGFNDPADRLFINLTQSF